MDDDFNNVLVLTIFVGGLVAVIVGYLLAWRAKRTAYRPRCRVRGSVYACMVNGRCHAPSTSRWKFDLGSPDFPSCLLATSTRRILHLCKVLSPRPEQRATEGLSLT